MRPTKMQHYMGYAEHAAQRATCSRASVGCAIISKQGQVLSTGYNGAPAGWKHCDHTDGGDLDEGHCAISVHAEQNAVAQAARHGVSIEGADAYLTHAPCRMCHLLLKSAGIDFIYYNEAYRLHPKVAADACKTRKLQPT